ncbi:hypothetical protein CLU96_3305 [Chryseobacterium sp. 52]|uniref:hypothetical protein n=1 Tax=Chryseobacterium sp. 52 TaxID=2035213 RepID=UPI000C1A1719|nr:hypothetical protein [Chryseobacterium sp. 52]PIF46280.1 hypothetical protein CLU96_3305 [Chryseobacterium sp. 52]
MQKLNLINRKHIVIQKTTIYYLWILLLLLITGNVKVSARLYGGSGCNTNYANFGFNSNNSAANIEYDNFTSAFHATVIRTGEGKFQIWGESTKNNGTDFNSFPQDINVTNFPAIGTSTPLKFVSGSRNTSSQTIMLTSEGLYVWGFPGNVISSSLKGTYSCAKPTLNGNGLPVGVSPANVKVLTASFQTVGILTCTGEVGMHTQVAANTGSVAPSVTNITNTCPATTANLNSAHTGTIPSNTTLVWYTNNTHTGTALSGTEITAAAAGTYYAFYKDNIVANSFSPASSAVTVAIVACCQSGTAAPILNNATNFNATTYGSSIQCGYTTANLSAITASNQPTPATVSLTWHTATPATNLNKITNITALTGTTKYYTAFYDSVNGCYSPTKEVVVLASICTGDDDYSSTPISSATGGILPTIFANDSYNGIAVTSTSAFPVTFSYELWIPANAMVNSNDGTITIPPGLTPGTYTYYYKLNDNDPDVGIYLNDSVGMVTFVIVCASGSSAPTVKTNLSNTCPANTANLQDAHTGTVPSGSVLNWYTNNTHAGFPLTPAQIASAGAGTYYAFYYASLGNCYSPVSSPVVVTILPCPSYCTKPALAGTPDGYTKLGITIQQKQSGWPEKIPNGHFALESKTKGMVITRVANSGLIADPKEGMLIYDIAASCVKLYNGSSWNCIVRSCNDLTIP